MGYREQLKLGAATVAAIAVATWLGGAFVVLEWLWFWPDQWGAQERALALAIVITAVIAIVSPPPPIPRPRGPQRGVDDR